jgi:membrane fusion protein, heavy metal efflux system
MSRRVGVGLGVGAALAIAGLLAANMRSGAGQRASVVAGEAPPAGALALSDAALADNPIATRKAARLPLAADLRIVGSVASDEDHYAVVGPLVAGRIVTLKAGLGDNVKRGQVLAEVESAEVGQAQAAFLSARARAGAAEANLRREKELSSQRISSQRELEVAEAQAVSEAAELRAATERLRALGLSPGDVASLTGAGGTGGRVPLRAPIDGTVVSRTVTLGQAVERATDAFKIVNLAKLWVLLDLYEKDLNRVRVGQKAELSTEAHPGEVFHARVGYVNPLIDEKTRTAHVRIELDNPGGKLRPGQFVTARLVGDGASPVEALAVPRSAVQAVEGRSVVFVRGPSGFARRAVELGASGGDLVEIRQGVAEGEEVVTDGAFLLKSELLR